MRLFAERMHKLQAELTPEHFQLVFDVVMMTALYWQTAPGPMTGKRGHFTPDLIKNTALGYARGHYARGLKGRPLARATHDDIVKLLGKDEAPSFGTLRDWLALEFGK